MATQHLVFDTTDAQSILDSSNVGAYVRASDGTLITATGTSLDVHFDNTTIDVTATDLDIRNLTQTDEVTVFQGTNPWIIADGGGSITVDAVDLDIRNLTAASDSVASWLNDGSGNAITSTGGALDVNLKTPLVVDVNLDGVYSVSNPLADSVGNIFNTRAVTPGITGQVERVTAGVIGTILAADANKVHALDVNAFVSAVNDVSGDIEQVTVNNANGGLNVNIANSLTVSDAALANVAIQSSAAILATANTAQVVVSSVLSDRKYLRLYNDGSKAIFIGDATVSAANGYPIFPGSEIDLRIGSAVAVDFVGQTGAIGNNAKLRALQLS